MLEDIDPDLIRIRAHHLLCIQGFQGYGYDHDFTMKMGEIIQILRSDPSPKIEIVSEADEICCICPNLVEKQCVDHFKIKKMDSYILNNTSLYEKQVLTFKTALLIINQELSIESIGNVCDGCAWVDKCLFFIDKIAAQ